eukprot:403095_1
MLAFLLVFYNVGVLAVLGLNPPRVIKPCSLYYPKHHVRHPELQCTSSCLDLEIPALCYWGTFKGPKTNANYRVVRYRLKKQNLGKASREYDCDRNKKHSRSERRVACGSAHVEKIEENRDNYCSDHHYKCVEKKGKYEWECYFKYGEWEHADAPSVEKEGKKVKGKAHWGEHPKFDLEYTLRYTFDAASECEPNQIKHITGDDVKPGLLGRMKAGLARKKSAYRELYDLLNAHERYYYDED